MAIELATAYVSLSIEASKVPGQVTASLKGIEPVADTAGKGIGSRLASGIGSSLAFAAKGIGLTAGALIGTALSQGFGRMVAIDDARGKLAGLGHDAASVATIMDSALAAVKGTAFGLGDAATIAASAVAAGVKPGEALTNYLKLTADAATIAGASLGEMGSIINKTTASGKVYTDSLNQLSDRGIPIFQWLQDEYKVSADGLSKMVKDGKVDAETFQRVIAENIGGAALESGKTLRGSFANFKAALGRIGEGALSPFLQMMKDGLKGATSWADQITPVVKRVSQNVATGLAEMGRAFQSHGASIDGTASNYEKFGARARFVYDGLQGVYSILRSGQFQGSKMTFGLEEDSGVVKVLFRIRESAVALADAFKSKSMDGLRKFWDTLRSGAAGAQDSTDQIKGVGATFSQTVDKLAGAAGKVSQAVLSAIGDTGIVLSVVIEHAAKAMAFLARNTDLVVTALIAYHAATLAASVIETGYQAARIANAIMMPAQIAATYAQTRALIAHTASLNALLASMGHEVPVTATTIRGKVAEAAARAKNAVQARVEATALYQVAAAQRTAVASVGLLAGAMRQVAASAATAGARVQGTTTAAFSGLRSAAGGLVSMMGGPWGIALAAGAAGLLAYKSNADQAKRVQDALSDAVVQGAKAQVSFRDAVTASNGVLNDQALAAAGKAVTAELAGVTEVAKEGHSAWSSFWNTTTSINQKLGGWTNDWGNSMQSQYADVQRAIEQNDALKNVLRDMKLEMSDLGPIVAEGGSQYDDLIFKLSATGEAGSDVVASLRDTRAELKKSSDQAKNSTPGFGALTQAVETLSDSAASADDRLNAMKRALDALTGKPQDAGEALQAYNEVLRDTADATKEAWDKSKGWGQELIAQDGTIDTTTANGDKLRSALEKIRDATAEVAITGGDLDEAFRRNGVSLEELAGATGLEVNQITALAESIGYMPDEIKILASLEGAASTTQQLVTIKTLLEKNAGGIEIPVETLSADAEATLKSLGVETDRLNAKENHVKITAPNLPDILTKLEELINTKLPDKTQNVMVKMINDAAVAAGKAPVVQAEQPRATGGQIFGAGGKTSDSVPALLSVDEHVWTADEVAAVGGHDAMYSLRSRALAGGLRFATGGTPSGVKKAIAAAKSVEGNAYLWGGSGPAQFDCSGFIGWLQQIVMGIEDSTERIYSTTSLLGGSTAGLKSGRGPSGTWFQVGVSEGHMAGTLAGKAVESGGAFGTSGIGGGRARAEDSQFTSKFYLPNSLVAGWSSGKNQQKESSKDEWTEKDQIDLDDLELKVDEAREARDKVYSDPDKNANDRRRADIEVRQAEQAVVDKQEEKDGALDGEDSDYTPQAPALTKVFTDEEADRISKQKAVESANTKRNEVYDDPDSTDLDKLQADADYSQALQDAQSSSTTETKSVRDIFTNWASTVTGTLFDSLKEQLPDAIGGSRWWTVADKAIELYDEYGPSATATTGTTTDPNAEASTEAQAALSGLPSFSPEDLKKQLGFNLEEGQPLPDWAKNIKVFDTGGWLMPGEAGINLSSTPEPIFNSPQQLRDFAGGQLDSPAGMDMAEVGRLVASRPNVTFQVTDIQSAMSAYRSEQKLQSKMFSRR